mmetsp:Transcript_7381/g.20666  ORF Transcript_7381/g.20666 Transcript_7381/m.20666 type:complete len:597 (+) Transcript_7381:24-1814(+)
MVAAGKDPCAPYRSGGVRGVSRACYAALWAARCTTQRWRDDWRLGARHLEQLTYEEVVAGIERHGHYGCHPAHEWQKTCGGLGIVLDLLAKMLYIGSVPQISAHNPRGREPDEFGDQALDLAVASRDTCGTMSGMLRLLLQRVPELFSNATRSRSTAKRLRAGVPLWAWRSSLHKEPLRSWLAGTDSKFSALRSASEAPFARLLRRNGLAGVDECAQVDFHGPVCSGQDLGIGGPVNITLWANFYRHRFPGLPEAMVERLKRSEDPLLRMSGLLAAVDRRRNLGLDYEDLLDDISFPWVSIEDTLPSAGPPTHLVWHFLDKLSLPLTVSVPVKPLNGATIEPHLPRLEMSVIPDRDIISDHVRNNLEFHCPVSFMELITERAEASPHEVLRVVEVGGFTGDCLLWAAAWLGPGRLRALEVEPVAAATAQLQRTLARNGLSEVITVQTEALGDGAVHNMDSPFVCSRKRPANPNFSVKRFLVDDGARGGGDVPAPGGRHCAQQLRALDDVLEAWPELPPGARVDVVRVKAAGSEPLILAGLRRHLAGSRVRKVHVETPPDNLGFLFEVMDWPQYTAGRDLANPKRSPGYKGVFTLAE